MDGSVVDVALQVLDDVVVAVDVQDGVFEVALELGPGPVHFGELGEDLVLWWLLVLLVRLIIVDVRVARQLDVLVGDGWASHLGPVDLALLLEAGCG